MQSHFFRFFLTKTVLLVGWPFHKDDEWERKPKTYQQYMGKAQGKSFFSLLLSPVQMRALSLILCNRYNTWACTTD